MKRTTIFTCSIYGDLTRIWYYYVRRFTDADCVDIVIYDCGAKLNNTFFSEAKIVKSRNIEHGIKIDNFLNDKIQTPYVFILDDDAFIVDKRAEPEATNVLSQAETNAWYGFKSRPWWTLNIEGQAYEPFGSYALVIKPEIMLKEQLSFASKPTNNPHIRNGSGYYDTADYAQEQLISRGYALVMAPEIFQEQIQTFFGTSSGYMTISRPRYFFYGRRKTLSRDKVLDIVRQDYLAFSRACSVAATIDVYQSLFNSKPDFLLPIDFSDLEEIAAAQQHEPDRKRWEGVILRTRRVHELLLLNSK